MTVCVCMSEYACVRERVHLQPNKRVACVCVWCAHVTRGVCEADTVIPDARARPLVFSPCHPEGLHPRSQQ